MSRNDNINVDCSVYNCKNNKQNRCTVKEIHIGILGCNTFKKRPLKSYCEGKNE